MRRHHQQLKKLEVTAGQLTIQQLELAASQLNLQLVSHAGDDLSRPGPQTRQYYAEQPQANYEYDRLRGSPMQSRRRMGSSGGQEGSTPEPRIEDHFPSYPQPPKRSGKQGVRKSKV